MSTALWDFVYPSGTTVHGHHVDGVCCVGLVIFVFKTRNIPHWIQKYFVIHISHVSTRSLFVKFPFFIHSFIQHTDSYV